MKTGSFTMRMSEETRAYLDKIAQHYNLKASAIIDMLIAKEIRNIKKEKTS